MKCWQPWFYVCTYVLFFIPQIDQLRVTLNYYQCLKINPIILLLTKKNLTNSVIYVILLLLFVLITWDKSQHQKVRFHNLINLMNNIS